MDGKSDIMKSDCCWEDKSGCSNLVKIDPNLAKAGRKIDVKRSLRVSVLHVSCRVSPRRNNLRRRKPASCRRIGRKCQRIPNGSFGIEDTGIKLESSSRSVKRFVRNGHRREVQSKSWRGKNHGAQWTWVVGLSWRSQEKQPKVSCMKAIERDINK
jgi:hypothetical protein